MSLDTTTRMLAPFLDRLTADDLDGVPFGVVELNAEGRILTFNRAEAENTHCASDRPISRDYFSEVAPSSFVAEVFGRYVEAFSSHHLDDVFRFTFTDSALPRTVMMHMLYSPRTGTLWLFTANPDGSPLAGTRAGPTCDVRDHASASAA